MADCNTALDAVGKLVAVDMLAVDVGKLVFCRRAFVSVLEVVVVAAAPAVAGDIGDAVYVVAADGELVAVCRSHSENFEGLMK